MKNLKEMTYKELETELIKNRCEIRTATLEQKRTIIARNHSIMTEMDSRWNKR